MRIWFSQQGLTNRIEENSWVFVEAPKAYAAVGVVSGAAQWEGDPTGPAAKRADGTPADDIVTTAPAKRANPFAPRGDWLTCNDEWTPVILEVACKEDFKDYAAFRQAVAACPLDVKDNVLTYRGLGGAVLTLPTNHQGAPTIDGRGVDYAPPMAFDSPFVRSAWNSGVVEITKAPRRLVLDFRD